jgi:hypothetical protein
MTGPLLQRSHRALVPQHLQPCALDQGAGDRGDAQGNPRGRDIVAAREKAIRVIEKLRALRLTRAAELVARVFWALTRRGSKVKLES